MISKSAVIRASLDFDCGVPSLAGMAVGRAARVFEAPSLKERHLIAKLQRGAQTPDTAETRFVGEVERSQQNFTFCSAVIAAHKRRASYEMRRVPIAGSGFPLHAGIARRSRSNRERNATEKGEPDRRKICFSRTTPADGAERWIAPAPPRDGRRGSPETIVARGRRRC
ncbi:MAG: hypothetical protein WAP03_09480 [Methylorubrum rhodinum]|uniref:hypothetical protein n=1 Tax=Methylorubrum rhodinum TaxID=29428 RepID=UPI003BAF307D